MHDGNIVIRSNKKKLSIYLGKTRVSIKILGPSPIIILEDILGYFAILQHLDDTRNPIRVSDISRFCGKRVDSPIGNSDISRVHGFSSQYRHLVLVKYLVYRIFSRIFGTKISYIFSHVVILNHRIFAHHYSTILAEALVYIARRARDRDARMQCCCYIASIARTRVRMLLERRMHAARACMHAGGVLLFV